MTFKLIEPHDVANANLVSSTIAENDHPEWDISTTYADGDKVIVIGTTHAIFESVQGSNLGNDPTIDDGTWWVNIGSTNRWKAFDNFIGDPSQQASSVEWVLTFSTLTDSVALFGLEADDVQIVVMNIDTSPDEEVYNVTHSLVDNSGVVDAWTYSFSPIIRRSDLVISDIPPYPNVEVTVTVTGSGTVSVGQVVTGRGEQIGTALDEVTLGIEDFSRKEQDAFGRYSITERSFANLLTIDFAYDTQKATYITRRLASRRAKPTVYTADSRYRDGDYAAYGFFLNFQPIARYATVSEGVIELESLT